MSFHEKIAKLKNKKLAEIKLHHTHIVLAVVTCGRVKSMLLFTGFFGPVRALWTLHSKLMFLGRNFAENYIKYSDSCLDDVFFTATFKVQGVANQKKFVLAIGNCKNKHFWPYFGKAKMCLRAVSFFSCLFTIFQWILALPT